MSIEDKIRGLPFPRRIWNDVRPTIRFFFPFYDARHPESVIYAKSFQYTFAVVFVSCLASLLLFKAFPANGENTGGVYLAVSAVIPAYFYRKNRQVIPPGLYRTFRTRIVVSFLFLFMIPFGLMSINFGYWLDKNPHVDAFAVLLITTVSYSWAFISVAFARLYVAFREYFQI